MKTCPKDFFFHLKKLMTIFPRPQYFLMKIEFQKILWWINLYIKIHFSLIKKYRWYFISFLHSLNNEKNFTVFMIFYEKIHIFSSIIFLTLYISAIQVNMYLVTTSVTKTVKNFGVRFLRKPAGYFLVGRWDILQAWYNF